MVPAAIHEARGNICKVCKTPCTERDSLDLTDACTSCPIGSWPMWDCGMPVAGHEPTRRPLERGRVLARPGDLLAIVIGKITGAHYTHTCDCAQRAAAMNEWGWWGCWTRRQMILGWLREEAAKRGHKVEQGAILELFLAAIRELQARRNGRADSMQRPPL